METPLLTPTCKQDVFTSGSSDGLTTSLIKTDILLVPLTPHPRTTASIYMFIKYRVELDKSKYHLVRAREKSEESKLKKVLKARRRGGKPRDLVMP